MQANNQILIVDEDPTVQTYLADGLQTHGYFVEIAADPDQALNLLKRRPFDVAVLGLDSSNNNGGNDLFDQIRGRWPNMVTIFLTGPATLNAAKIASQNGASEYLLKPAELSKLVDVIQRQLNKQRSFAPTSKISEPSQDILGEQKEISGRVNEMAESEFLLIKVGELVIDPLRSVVLRGGEKLPLSANEFATLNYLVSHADRVVVPRELVRTVQTDDTSEEAIHTMVRAKIKRLRRKLGDDARNPRYILNVRGKGYRFQL